MQFNERYGIYKLIKHEELWLNYDIQNNEFKSA